MTKKRDRFFALFGAILFLVTASAFTLLVIWTMATSNNQDNGADSTTDTTATATDKLEGTKLANFTPTSSVPKLIATDTVKGTGDTVKKGDEITVDYTGAVAATGVIFQSSLDTGDSPKFPLREATATQNGVLKGWVDGLEGMKVGGTRRVLIPADQAYGATPPAGSGIPVNAPLVFDVTVKKITK